MSEHSNTRGRRVRPGQPAVSAPLRHYRKEHPLSPKTPGELCGGRLRILRVSSAASVASDASASVHSFSVTEAAEALGRSVLTLRKWIKDSLIPAPIFEDVSKRNLCYTLPEIEAIAACLEEHERSFVYLGVSHRTSITLISRAVAQARATVLRDNRFY